MVWLIDANIILDVLMNRKEFVRDSSLIWKYCEVGKAKGYVSALTFANLVYVMRKQLTPQQIAQLLDKLNLIFEFADFTSTVLAKAANMQWTDFEDAIQSATAEATHADYIITRNTRDFEKNSVKAVTPTMMLEMLQK